MKFFLRIFFLICFSISANVIASDLIMARSHLSFSEAMTNLQVSLREHGYTVARVQRIDVGLTGMGYKTDMYRVVFVGKTDEIKYLADKYPQMIPYLPPKVSIFAEEGDTLLVTANPIAFAQMVDDEKDRLIFERWESDVYSVFDDFRNAE
ncbi:MAG: DUF302 domain-containing protein [Gammaproteobacteria bacterium]|nr:DUF302 domain-containing protein [Gammaproteobacteria bacterium]